MLKNKKSFFFTILLYGLFFVYNPLYAWDNTLTHPEITRRVLRNKLDDIQVYLEATLGLTNGIMETFNGDTLLDIIVSGSDTEDGFGGISRANNHFYNPLSGGSGLLDFGFSGESNLEWAQDHNNEYSWPRAREYYYQALTEADNQVRSQKFALAFRSLGQVMHLIQDMAVPAHTRNDFRGHLDFVYHMIGNNFELYVKWHQQHPEDPDTPVILSYFNPGAVPDLNNFMDFWHTGG